VGLHKFCALFEFAPELGN